MMPFCGCWFCYESKWFLKLLLNNTGDPKREFVSGISSMGCSSLSLDVFKVFMRGSSIKDAILTRYLAHDNNVSLESYVAYIDDTGKMILESANRQDKYVFVKLAEADRY